MHYLSSPGKSIITVPTKKNMEAEFGKEILWLWFLHIKNDQIQVKQVQE